MRVGRATRPLAVLLVDWLVLRPYYLGHRLKRVLKRSWPKLPLLKRSSIKLLSHHQSILYLLLLGALLVMTNSWRVRQAAAEDFGQHNLLFPLIKPDFELLVTESGAGLIPPPTLPDVGLPGATTPTETPLPLTGGTAILKPHLVTTAPSTAARTAIEYYEIEPGDTISGIATRFGLSATTLLWENRLSERSLLRIGQKLTILPTDGVTYRIGRGDTVAKIATRYRVATEDILTYNKLVAGNLTVGQTIVVPGGRPPAAPARAVTRTTTVSPIAGPTASTTRLLWPTAAKHLTQYYTWRHGGVDIAGPSGTAIYAAEEGIVEVAGWNSGGYGYYIIIDHGGGLKTLYGHSSKLLVAVGDRVERGQHIANVGSTGRSTGPHLHFEVRVRGVRTNPLNYVR